jgi:hypothetical protein
VIWWAKVSDDPYVHLSFRDRLELLAFEARLAGFPESLIQALWQAIPGVTCGIWCADSTIRVDRGSEKRLI